MTSSPVSGSWSVEQLLEAVNRLPLDEQREFHRRLAERNAANGDSGPDEAMLVKAAQARLPAAAERRLRKLIARSESGRLTPQELAEYQSLAQEVQRIDVARAEALAQLAYRQERSVQAVKAALDHTGGDGA